MNFGFTYAGLVESNKDPLKLGRLKVRVPHVYGSDATGSGYIAVNDLPWAMPAGMPAGGSASSGGFSQIPSPGDKVWVRFLDGEPEKPIWEWGMQSTADRDALKLHRYATGTPVGAPDRTLWTRYSHAIEINEGSIIVTTSQGYRLVVTDASGAGEQDGKLTLTTQKGNLIALDDLDDTMKVIVLEDLYFTVGTGVIGTSDSFSWETMTQDFDLTAGGAFNLTTVDGISLTTASDTLIDSLGDTEFTTSGDMLMGFATLQMGLAATEPAVLGAQLELFLNSLLLWLSTHTHTSASPGSPTSPPNVPPLPTVQPPVADLLSTTITLQD